MASNEDGDGDDGGTSWAVIIVFLASPNGGLVCVVEDVL